MRRFRPTRGTRLRLTLLVVLSLLFQQVALASYACSTVGMPVSNAGMTAHCDGMPMTHGKQDPALCPTHCAQPVLAAQDAHAPTVPPLSIPALLPAPIVLTALPTTYTAREHAAAWRLSGIPPALGMQMNQNVPGMQRSETARGTGVAKVIDTTKGTITTQHQAITSIHWPAMTMIFRTDPPGLLRSIKVGEKVNFTLRPNGMKSTVTAISPAK